MNSFYELYKMIGSRWIWYMDPLDEEASLPAKKINIRAASCRIPPPPEYVISEYIKTIESDEDETFGLFENGLDIDYYESSWYSFR